jgi:hypothetical protein
MKVISNQCVSNQHKSADLTDCFTRHTDGHEHLPASPPSLPGHTSEQSRALDL